MRDLLKYMCAAAVAAMTLSLGSCRDDLFDVESVPVGEPATITLKVETGERSVYTRAASDNTDDENRVRTLWVGIYSSSSGERNFFYHYTKAGEYGFSPTTTNIENNYQTLTNINTLSGPSYIVAVANPDTNKGFKVDKKSGTPQTEVSLLTLLQNATTWDDFLSIVISSQPEGYDGAYIEKPEIGENEGMAMAGIYVEGGKSTALNAAHPGEWGEVQPTVINPGTDNLSGAIHLRRPYSHINFEVQASGDVISVETTSYEVVNVPTYSWLFERSIGRDTENPGDLFSTLPVNNPYYQTSPNYTSTFIQTETVDGAKVQKFDWWQFDNKRHGTGDFYSERELQWGLDGKGAAENPLGDGKWLQNEYTQTGLYSSLCSKYDMTNNPNNNATYVRIRATVTYRARTTESDNTVPEQNDGKPDKDGNSSSPVTKPNVDAGSVIDNSLPTDAVRTAEMVYTVHLGYIDKDAKDYNTLRNSEYTYRMTVSGLKNVLVEAFREGDPQPGAEGVVTDTEFEPFELDCHYGAFNIHLTDEELRGFTYIMTTYENGTANTYYERIKAGSNPASPEYENNASGQGWDSKHFNWVRIAKLNSDLPTKTPTAIADYATKWKISQQTPNVADPGGLMLMNEVRTLATKGSLTAGWYTVFINEYAYESGADETAGNWRGYVNQPDRQLYIYVNERTSYDSQTKYYHSKYMATQRSIQTYYSFTGDSQTAIGVEHANENLGMDMRWLWGTASSTNMQKLLNENGRQNVWQFLRRYSPSSPTTYNATASTNRSQWANYVDTQSILSVNAISGQGLTAGASVRNLPAVKTIPNSNFTETIADNYSNGYKSTANIFDPQGNSTTAQYIEVMNACMNRNRDEDGDGEIDANELKWYVPSATDYVQILMGRNSLRNPLMTYPDNIVTPQGGTHDSWSRWRVASSDAKIIWMDQGMASSFLLNGSYSPVPWQVRCIRNLGTNLTTVQSGDKSPVTTAYQVHQNGTGSGGKVTVKGYGATCLRAATTQPLPVHYANSNVNRVGMYGFEWYTSNIAISPGNNLATYKTYLESSSPCSEAATQTGKTGWRAPTLQELAILRFISGNGGLFSSSGGLASCTMDPYNDSGALNGTGIQRFMVMIYNDTRDPKINDITSQTFSTQSYIRCVRDLTAAEANALSTSTRPSATRTARRIRHSR